MCMKSDVLEVFAEYIEELENMELRDFSRDKGSLIFSMQIPTIPNSNLMCVMKYNTKNEGKIYFEMYGTGKIKKKTTEFLKQLNQFNDSFDEKVFFNEKDNLVIRFITDNQMIVDEQCEWITGMISIAATRATMVYEDFAEYL